MMTLACLHICVVLSALLQTAQSKSLVTRRDGDTQQWSGPAYSRHLVLGGTKPSRDHSGVDADLQIATSLPAHLECPRTSDGRQLFPCVSGQDDDIVVCIDEHALCDDAVHCPNGEDEDATVCMFHRMTLNYFKLVIAAISGLARSAI